MNRWIHYFFIWSYWALGVKLFAIQDTPRTVNHNYPFTNIINHYSSICHYKILINLDYQPYKHIYICMCDSKINNSWIFKQWLPLTKNKPKWNSKSTHLCARKITTIFLEFPKVLTMLKSKNLIRN